MSVSPTPSNFHFRGRNWCLSFAVVYIQICLFVVPTVLEKRLGSWGHVSPLTSHFHCWNPNGCQSFVFSCSSMSLQFLRNHGGHTISNFGVNTWSFAHNRLFSIQICSCIILWERLETNESFKIHAPALPCHEIWMEIYVVILFHTLQIFFTLLLWDTDVLNLGVCRLHGAER